MPTDPSGRSRQPARGAAMIAGAALIVGCNAAGSAAGGPSSAPTTPSRAPAATGQPASQAPVPAEHNPPGDIPDTTVYVAYRSAGGHLTLKVPEGWARQDTNTSATFISNLNSISVAWLPMRSAPTVGAVRAVVVPSLSRSSFAFRLQSVQPVALAGGSAIEIIYQVNSPPNSVTGRQYRLVIQRFELYRNGHGAFLSLSSAVGSDNVDPWRIVSESFRWV